MWRSRSATTLVAAPLCKSSRIALTREAALVANPLLKLLAEPLYNFISRRWSRSKSYWRSRYTILFLVAGAVPKATGGAVTIYVRKCREMLFIYSNGEAVTTTQI